MASTYSFTETIPKPQNDTKYLTDYYTKVAAWTNQAHEEAVSLQRDVPEIRDIQNALDYLCGLQWKQEMPSYRAKPVSNEILAMFWETIGLLTDIKPMFKITDIGSVGKFSKTESILNKLAKGWAGTSLFQRQVAAWTMVRTLTAAPAPLY